LALQLVLSLRTLGLGTEPEHYVRPPFKFTDLTGPVADFSLSSDGELTALVVLEGGASGRVRAALNDGRALSANWTPSVTISEDSNVPRRLARHSCIVFEDQAFVTWLDDRDGAAATRVLLNRYDQATSSWLPAPLEVRDSAYPPGADVEDWRTVVQRGTNGAVHVYVMVLLRAAGQDHVHVTVSTNAAASFNASFRAHAGAASPGDVGGIACDARLGELHLAWSDDRAGSSDVYHRLALLSFSGAPIFTGPEALVGPGPGGGVVAGPILQAGGEFGWSGSDQKHVGIAYLQDGGDGTSDLRVATSRDDGASFTDLPIARTVLPGVDVDSFDLEIPGDTFVLAWADDGEGSLQVFRSESDEGLAFLPPVQVTPSLMPAGTGSAPRLSPSSGTPDGSMLVLVEEGPQGPEVLTSFGDQAFGGEWHDDEYPAVSDAQAKGPGILVEGADVAYNERYYNFVVGWRQESFAGSGPRDLWLGGYRPPFVVTEGWHQGSPAVRFLVPHLPFQDTFGFVSVSLQPPTNGPGELLYDGRRTGFVPDGITSLLRTTLFGFCVFQNDSANEGGATQPLPIPPFAAAPPITVQAVSADAFGDLHTLTEPFRTPFGPPRP
jgi:hypothetical protein